MGGATVHPDCPTLAPKGLFQPPQKYERAITPEFIRHTESLNTGFIQPPEHQVDEPFCLILERVMLQKRGLSDKVADTILASRKKVTRATYEKVHKKMYWLRPRHRGNRAKSCSHSLRRERIKTLCVGDGAWPHKSPSLTAQGFKQPIYPLQPLHSHFVTA